ncbi:hypothetical protein N7454_005150, partial [Penicillium verhagenii]
DPTSHWQSDLAKNTKLGLRSFVISLAVHLSMRELILASSYTRLTRKRHKWLEPNLSVGLLVGVDRASSSESLEPPTSDLLILLGVLSALRRHVQLHNTIINTTGWWRGGFSVDGIFTAIVVITVYHPLRAKREPEDVQILKRAPTPNPFLDSRSRRAFRSRPATVLGLGIHRGKYRRSASPIKNPESIIVENKNVITRTILTCMRLYGFHHSSKRPSASESTSETVDPGRNLRIAAARRSSSRNSCHTGASA